MGCMINGREIVLSGDVGETGGWFWDGDGFTSSDVIIALAQIGHANDVTIRLNSGGGIAWEGSAIHSAIARHQGKKTIIVEGIAASAASIIAMAGDDVEMSLGAMMMVHAPSGMTIGTAKDHQDQINCLTALTDSMASIYADKTGQSVEACRADMEAETWMTADQAVAKGYADRVGELLDDDTPVGIEPAPFAYRAYRHAPEPILALADARHWNKRLPKAASPAAKPTAEEKPLPTEQEIQARIDAAVAKAREDDAAAAAQAAQATADTRDGEGTVEERALSRSDAAEIAQLCVDSGVPSMAATLIREGVTTEAAKARVDAAGKIKDVVAMARRVSPSLSASYADEAISKGQTVQQVKADLFDKMAAADEALPVLTMHRAGAGGTHTAGDQDDRARSKANMQKQVAKTAKKEG